MQLRPTSDQAHQIVATLFQRKSVNGLETRAVDEACVKEVIQSLQLLGSDAHRPATGIALDFDRVFQVKFSDSNNFTGLNGKVAVAKLELEHGIDIVVQPAWDLQRPIKLAVFDMDSTLIEQEVIDLLASYAGVEAQVAEITAQAMNGELDFTASLERRVALLKGLPETVFEDLKPRLTLMPGAAILLKCLKTLGIRTAVLSGGFLPLARELAHILEIDYVHANSLAVQDGILTGQLDPTSKIVNAEMKRELLRSIADLEGVTDRNEILAVGDGANDLLMLAEAGLGIAVNAKPRVQELAPCRLNCDSLADILHVLGYTKNEIMDLTRQ